MVRAFCTSSSGVFLTDYLDVISEYCFGKSSHRVEAKDFGLASVTQSKKVRIALYLHFDGCREIAQGLIGSRDSMPILRE
jgi:hypothetical protein